MKRAYFNLSRGLLRPLHDYFNLSEKHYEEAAGLFRNVKQYLEAKGPRRARLKWRILARSLAF